jgi:hypothetical protein
MLKYQISIQAKLGTRAQQRWLACIARAIDDLRNHRTHLSSLDETTLIVVQCCLTDTCISVFDKLLRDLNISCGQEFCQCVSRGSNRTNSFREDIVITRVGDDATNHFAAICDRVLQIRDKGLLGDGNWREVFDRYVHALERLCAARRRLELEPGKNLVSHEILTRGYRFEFDIMTDEELRRLRQTDD